MTTGVAEIRSCFLTKIEFIDGKEMRRNNSVTFIIVVISVFRDTIAIAIILFFG